MALSLSATDRILGGNAFLGVWLHVLSEWNLPVCVKPWNKIMQECRYKMSTWRGYVLHFSVGFTELIGLLWFLHPVFLPPSHENVHLCFRGTLEPVSCLMCALRALCVAFSVCTPERSGVCIFLQCHFIIYQGNATHNISLLYSNGMIGTAGIGGIWWQLPTFSFGP